MAITHAVLCDFVEDENVFFLYMLASTLENSVQESHMFSSQCELGPESNPHCEFQDWVDSTHLSA